MSNTDKADPDDLSPEYDLPESRPNPYAERYGRGTNLVRLDPDVAKIFPDSAAVNGALRALARIIEERSSAA
jgi:hypothetical protein